MEIEAYRYKLFHMGDGELDDELDALLQRAEMPLAEFQACLDAIQQEMDNRLRARYNP